MATTAPACQAAKARKAWAVRSVPLRSKGSVPHPRQNVGQPPSRFCNLSSHSVACRTAQPIRARRCDRPRDRAPDVQREQCPGRIVRIGNGAAQIAPAESAGIGAGEGMSLLVLASQKPIETIRRQQFRNIFAAGREGIDRKRRDPRRQIRIDRPTAVGAHGIDEELNPRARHFMFCAADGGEAHHDEARQRRRFEIAAAIGLHLP